MNRKPTIALAAAAAALCAVLAGCAGSSTTTGAQQEQQDSQSIEKSFLANQPPPHFNHSDIRATAISIEAIQALGEQTTSFAFQQGDPNPIWSCPSLGEPVASTTQITNQQQVLKTTIPYREGAAVPIGNMDPNGIYAGDSTGTYVLCVNAGGTPYAEYWEGNVDSVSGPAHWDSGTHQIVVTGQPTMPNCTVSQAPGGKASTNCTK